MKILEKTIGVFIKGGIGLLAVYLTNMALDTFDIGIGINVINGLVIGILGISGYILLYVLSLIDLLIF